MSSFDQAPPSGEGFSHAGLKREFELATTSLLDLQEEVGSLLIRSASDPLFEHRLRHRLEDLQRQRKDLMITWARIALTWKMAGGSLILGGDLPEGAAPGLAAATRATTTAPTVRGEPEVISRTRIRRADAPSSSVDGGPVHEAAPPARVVLDFDHAALLELLRVLGEPGLHLESVAAVRDELNRLSSGSTAMRMDAWARMPKPVQQALVGIVVSRARHIQDEVDPMMVPIDMAGDLDRVFSTMTSFSKREQPGFVFGLQRHHHPRGLTWLADARRWWADLADFLPDPGLLNPDRALAELRRAAAVTPVADENDALLAIAGKAIDAGLDPEDARLVTAMAPHYDALRKEARFKHLRKAIRDLRKLDEQSEAELTGGAELPEDWAFEGLVEGRIAVVVGDVPAPARKRLGEVFRWARADWITGDAGSVLEDAIDRIRQGQVDHVIVVRRFAGLDVDRLLLPACELARVPVADIAGGYGVTAFRKALAAALDQG